MIGVVHMGLVLPVLFLLLALLSLLILLNLLAELIVLGEERAVGLIPLRHLLLVREQLADDLIHCGVGSSGLRSLFLFNDLTPVHVFEFVTDAALPNDAFEDLHAVPQLPVLVLQVEVLVVGSVQSFNVVIDLTTQVTVSVH